MEDRKEEFLELLELIHGMKKGKYEWLCATRLVVLLPWVVPVPLASGGHGSLGGSPGCAGVLQSRRTAVFGCDVSAQPALKVGKNRVRRILVLFFIGSRVIAVMQF